MMIVSMIITVIEIVTKN